MAETSLTIQIGADSSKLRADLALADARLKELAASLKAAAKTALPRRRLLCTLAAVLP
jgi:hypothetical protein